MQDNYFYIDLTALLIMLPTFLLRSLEFISPFKCFLIPSGKSMTFMTHGHFKKIYDIHIEKIQFCRFFLSFDIVKLVKIFNKLQFAITLIHLVLNVASTLDFFFRSLQCVGKSWYTFSFISAANPFLGYICPSI